MPQLITDNQRAAMEANGRCYETDEDFDPLPGVSLFTPDAGAVWLLASIDPEFPCLAVGLCDLGAGFPELGSVSLAEIAELRGRLGLQVERDLGFAPTKTLFAYASDARRARRIVTD